MAIDLEQAIDELYAVELSEFTRARNELAKRLRDEKRGDEAEHVKALKKPSVSAWIVNQLARQRRKDIDLLLDAGHRIREAQRGVLTGSDRADFDEARKRQQRALDALRDAAKQLGGSGATLDRVSNTLRAAAITDGGREQLALGRFTSDLALTGFEAVEQLGVASKPSQRAKKAKQPPRRELVQAARAEVTAARRRERDARAAVEQAGRALESLRREADEAARALEDAERRLRDAQQRS